MNLQEYAAAADKAYEASLAANHADAQVDAWLVAEQAYQQANGTIVDINLCWTTSQEAAVNLRSRRLRTS